MANADDELVAILAEVIGREGRAPPPALVARRADWFEMYRDIWTGAELSGDDAAQRVRLEFEQAEE